MSNKKITTQIISTMMVCLLTILLATPVAVHSTNNTTEVVSTESTDYSRVPSLALDPDGDVHVAWMDLTDYGGSGTDWDIFYKMIAAPNADADGPYEGYEGFPITFDASGSTDEDGTIVLYEWNLDGDGTYETPGQIVSYTWGDDYTGLIGLRVTDDDGLSDTDFTTVTVKNVDPTVEGITMVQPNPEFILPIIHELEFTGTFTDVGTLDTHTAVWDWGDLTTTPGIVSESGGSGTVTGTHVYSDSGDYTVTLTVTDDDTGTGEATIVVIVVTFEEAKHITNEYIQSLPVSAFKNNLEQRKKAFDNMFSAIDDMYVDGDYRGVIKVLLNNIRSKADGLVDGSLKNDWIIEQSYQEEICRKIDDLIAYLETFL